MLDKIKLMEMLEDLKEIAKTEGNVLSQEEIKEYFNGMDLSEDHYTHIYSYLAENQIEIQGFDYKKEVPEEPMKEEDSIFLKMYLKELRTLEKISKDEEVVLLREVKNEIPGAKDRLVNVWLPKVVRIAKKYKNQGVFLEDLIQEGNIGLLNGIKQLPSLDEAIDMKTYLEEVIKKTMEEIIDDDMEEDDLENTIIGRSNLIQEAAKYLAEDLGRVATIDELAEYTKISVEEINNIRTLSLDALKVGKGE